VPFELALALRYLRFHRGRAFLSVITWISDRRSDRRTARW